MADARARDDQAPSRGATLAVIGGGALLGAAAGTWFASKRDEPAIDARTRQRLAPLGTRPGGTDIGKG